MDGDTVIYEVANIGGQDLIVSVGIRGGILKGLNIQDQVRRNFKVDDGIS